MAFNIICNEKNKTVIAYMDDPIAELYKEFYEFYKKNDIFTGSFEKFNSKYGKQINAIRGIARCNTEKGDIFDAKIGEKIATQKYLKIFESYRTLMYRMILEDLNILRTKAEKRIFNSINRRRRRSNKINDLASGKIKE